jgi:carboxyl-terminal processing protease
VTPSRLRRVGAALVAAQLLLTMHASPGLDLFDEAAYHLTLLYAGPADVAPRDLLPDARERLSALCATRGACPESLALAAIDEVIAAVGDEHTSLIPGDAFDRLQLELTGGGEVDGFGIVVRAPANGLGLVVVDVLSGSAAEEAGLQRGDRILKIGDATSSAQPEARYGALAEAEAAGRATLLALRAGSAPLTFTLTARPLTTDRAPTMALIGGIAWIRIPTFLPPLEVAPAFHALLREAIDAGGRGVIIDLRDNPGGAITECLAAAAAFSDAPGRVVFGFLRQTIQVEGSDVIVSDAVGRTFPLASLPERVRWPGPTAVLVNAGSASCAEFMATDLQAVGAIVIGEATAGVGNSTTAFVRLPNGFGLAVTTASLVALDGTEVAARVTPDHVIADDLMKLSNGDDAPLRAAITLLDAEATGSP